VKLIIRDLVQTFRLCGLLRPCIICFHGVEVRHSDLFLGIISTDINSIYPEVSYRDLIRREMYGSICRTVLIYIRKLT
jgi:hypothetical protein